MTKRIPTILTAIGTLGCIVLPTLLADKPDPPAQNRIRQALDGKDTAAPTDDGVLDDVLQVIRQRGSILDGSVLDDRQERPAAAARDRQALVAEQLLKASRLLQSLEQPDQSRSELIRDMRAEAGKLLSD